MNNSKYKIQRSKFRNIAILLAAAFALFLGIGSWVWWGDWPVLEREDLPWEPDVIVVLGGGNEERPREALRLAATYPDVPVVVTGDGGMISGPLLAGGLDAGRLHHEKLATSTMENAGLTASLLDGLDAERVVLVTNWFHAPRALAVFRREQPERAFAAAFEPRPAQLSGWHRHVSRRERLAALHHLLRHGIWVF